MNENIINQLADKDKERIRGYRDLLEFYQGKQWQGRERWGEKRLTFNYARVFIDKLTSYLMSGINFAVDSLEDTTEALAAAQRAEKALTRVYDANGLEQLDYETETDCAILGDACYKVVWDPDIKDVRVTAPDIQGIYVWWVGDNLSRVWRVAARYTLTSEEVGLLYKIKTASKSAAIVEIWTDREFYLYLDGVLLEKKANPYGFIPFVIFANLRDPKKFWGTSDLVPVIESQRELNRAMSQVSHILELSGNPVAVLENVEGSSDIAVRPGAVWNIPEDAKAYLLDLLQGGGLQLHINYIDLLYRALHDISESPRAAFGGLGRNLSGVAMQIELYPLLQKVIRKRLIRSSTYIRRNRMVLSLLEKFNGDNFGQYRLRTVWGQVFPQDQAQLVANEQTLVNCGIHSHKRAMDEVGVKDPEAEFRHWMEEQEQIRKLQVISSGEKE